MSTQTPIALRPDYDAMRRENVRALNRAVFSAAKRAVNPHMKSATSPATTTDSLWAAPLSGPVVGDYISSLVPISAGAKLLEQSVRVSLDGISSILFPRRSGAISSTAVPWVTEGSPAPVLEFVLESVELSSTKKLVAIVVMTRELICRGRPPRAVSSAPSRTGRSD